MNENERPADAESARSTAELKRLLVRIGATLVLIASFFALFGIYIEHGNTMYPSLRDGDAYICFRPGSGELAAETVVTFRHGGERRTARIVATAGDVVNITDDGQLFINDKLLREDYIGKTQTYPVDGGISYPYTVEDGCYFVLCDKRTDGAAVDSRSIGALSAKDVDGHLILLFRRRGF